MSLLALVLPWLLVGGILHCYLPLAGPGRPALVWGLGGFFALLLTAGYVFLWGVAGLPYQRTAMLILPATGFAAMLLLVARRGVSAPGLPEGRPSGRTLLAACFLLMIVVHFALAAAEVWYRPLFPFDATSAWATKAKVWVAAGHWVPFVEKATWLADTGGRVFTDHRPGYPVITPLLQAWMGIANGAWDSRMINLPWLLAYLSLLLVCYGFGRQLGVSALLAILFTYFVASMPLLNTHVALAGYADLFMALGVLVALGLLALWARQRRLWQALMLAIVLWACSLIKNEGLFWSAAIAAGAVTACLPGWRGALVLGLLTCAACLVVALVPADLEVAGHTLEQLGLRYRPDALRPFLQNFFMTNSWHLAFFLVPGALVFWLLRGRPGRDIAIPLLVALGVALVLLAILFLFTGYSLGAIRFTAVSRITLALAPGLLFLSMLWVALPPRSLSPARA